MSLRIYVLVLAAMLILGCAAQGQTAPANASQAPQPGGVKCTDSDQGNDAGERGVTLAGGILDADTCINATAVQDYECSQDGVVGIVVNCLAGQECRNGACVEPSDTQMCIDTEAGINATIKGNVVVSNLTAHQVFEDACINASVLKEYFCDGNTEGSVEIQCAPGFSCSAGACVEDRCVDTDPESSVYKSGVVTKGSLAYQDMCTGNSGGIEYYCYANNVGSSSFTCLGGYSCSDGQCVKG